MLLKNIARARRFIHMKHRIKHFVVAAALCTFASAAAADCTAVYKAKQDNPLRLEHGSLIVSGPCTTSAARLKVETMLASRGWTLLKVLSVSGN
jgi:hypothetical protein